MEIAKEKELQIQIKGNLLVINEIVCEGYNYNIFGDNGQRIATGQINENIKLRIDEPGRYVIVLTSICKYFVKTFIIPSFLKNEHDALTTIADQLKK